jgi:hypothetical protein
VSYEAPNELLEFGNFTTYERQRECVCVFETFNEKRMRWLLQIGVDLREIGYKLFEVTAIYFLKVKKIKRNLGCKLRTRNLNLSASRVLVQCCTTVQTQLMIEEEVFAYCNIYN